MLRLFQQKADEVSIQIGVYDYGVARDFNIATDSGTTEQYDLVDVYFLFNEHHDIIFRGTVKKTKFPFEKIIKKDAIAWSKILHIHGYALDKDLELCYNPNEGMLDVQLKNDESIIINYRIDKNKKNTLIA